MEFWFLEVLLGRVGVMEGRDVKSDVKRGSGGEERANGLWQRCCTHLLLQMCGCSN